MPFQPSKPLATDQLNQSQADLAANFTAIGTQLDPNFGYVKFPREVAVPVTAATTVGLYGAVSSTDPATTALWFLPQAGGAPRDFTTYSYNGATFEGSYTLPSGLIIKWGFSDAGGGVSDRDIIFATAFPTNTINIQATVHWDGTGAHLPHDYDFYVTYINRSHFTLHLRDYFGAYWYALGY